MRTTIATASNDTYFVSLKHLLRSLDGISSFGHFDIHILDVGLTEAQRAELVQAGHTISIPGWDVDVSPWKGVPEWFKAMTARPFLPSYVKGADQILWIDADIWVQDQRMLLDFVRAAQDGSLAICLEMDRSYDNVFMRNGSRDIYYNNLSSYYGTEVANRLVQLPMMNCGVFAMVHDHPLWTLWQNTAKGAIKKFCSNFLEQTALNMAVHTHNIKTHYLPARHNWMTCHAIPLLDEATGCFVEPNLPHDKIGLVHLACGLWKRDDIDYRTTGGRTCKGPLRPRAAS